jgi:hypothetical protein
MTAYFQQLGPERLLGLLKEVEAKSAPQALLVAGGFSIFHVGPRVSVVGRRKPSEELDQGCGLPYSQRLPASLAAPQEA